VEFFSKIHFNQRDYNIFERIFKRFFNDLRENNSLDSLIPDEVNEKYERIRGMFRYISDKPGILVSFNERYRDSSAPVEKNWYCDGNIFSAAFALSFDPTEDRAQWHCVAGLFSYRIIDRYRSIVWKQQKSPHSRGGVLYCRNYIIIPPE